MLAARVDVEPSLTKPFERLLVRRDDKSHVPLFRDRFRLELKVQVRPRARSSTPGQPHCAALDARGDGDLLEAEKPVEMDAGVQF